MYGQDVMECVRTVESHTARLPSHTVDGFDGAEGLAGAEEGEVNIWEVG